MPKTGDVLPLASCISGGRELIASCQSSEIERMLGRMAKPTGEITLANQPVKVGAQWHVVGTYPSGQQERITGFKTEADALDWIANDSADWLEKRRSR